MNPGDRVRVERTDESFEGVLLPSTTADHLVVKLDGGYNVGVDRADAGVEVLESGVYEIEEGETSDESAIEFDGDLPTIALISTGGTIASTVDYRTGAVTARFDAEDVLRAVPDLAGLANYRGRVVANILSENMTTDVWVDLAHAIHDEIENDADGVVVMHGTDTMQFSAAAMSFMLDTPVPIVFTGSQRSADRPSSDNVMNAVCAVEAAKSDCAEVLVCMHATESDDVCALHRGTRVRKNHTSRRDAFRTVGAKPLGEVDYESREVSFRRGREEPRRQNSSNSASPETRSVSEDSSERTSGRSPGVAKRGDADLDIHPDLVEDVELLKFTPGTDEALLDLMEGKSGLVLEGTGLGHVHSDWADSIADLVDDGTTVVMTSQCIEGRVCDRVYDTGRDLLDAGVIEGEDMLPGTAKVKLMWVLANAEGSIPESDESGAGRGDNSGAVAEAMRTPIAGELTERSVPWE